MKYNIRLNILYMLTDISINENEKYLVLFVLNQLTEMLEEGNINDDDLKETGYPSISLSSIYELKDRLEAEIV